MAPALRPPANRPALPWAETSGVGLAGAVGIAWMCGFKAVGSALPLQALRSAGAEVPPAAAPQRALVAVLERLLSPDQAMSLGIWLLLGAGGAAIWHLRRSEGSPRPQALLAAAFGVFCPVMLTVLGQGNLELLAIPLVVGSLALAGPRPGWAAFLTLLAGLGDAHLGLLSGLGAALVGGGWPLAFAGLVAGGLGPEGSSDGSHLDPLALLAPWYGNPAGIFPGIALLLASVLLPPSWRRVALLGWLASTGPIARLAGEQLTVNHQAIPAPGLPLAFLLPDTQGWGAGLVLVVAAVGLGLRRSLGWTLGLSLLLGAEALRSSDFRAVHLDLPLAVADMEGRQGTVLHLPLSVTLDEVDLRTAPPGSHSLYQWWGFRTHRSTLPSLAPLGSQSPLYNEPLVVAAINLSLREPRYLVPPALPVDALRTLGITEVVLHRSFFSENAYKVLEPVFQHYLGAPQADTDAQVLVYRVPEGQGHPLEPAQTLRRPGEDGSTDWRTLNAWLREVARPPGAKHE